MASSKRKLLYERVTSYFRQAMPVARTELNYGTTFQLLVAVMLSAQCTDKRENRMTPQLFAKDPDAKSMAEAEGAVIYELIKSVSYPNAKAKHLVKLARMLMDDFNGEVPQQMEQLTSLPGVGRKTANVMQAVAFGKSAIAVDTHVFRVSHRLGLVSKKADTPLKVELELKKNIPEHIAADAHHWLLLHGRYICTSRAPHCDKCPFDDICPKRLEGSKL